MTYWVIINNEKLGPMSLEELRCQRLDRDTLVWHEGLPSWQRACTLAELADVVPGVGVDSSACYVETDLRGQTLNPSQAEREQLRRKPRTYLGWNFAALILCCMIPAIVGLVYSTRVSSLYYSGDYEAAEKASERAELWLIISIVAGLVWLPFGLLTIL